MNTSSIESNNPATTNSLESPYRDNRATHTDRVNILLVDDNPQNLFTLSAVLNCPQYNLVSANSGEEALKHVLMHDFAVILLDVQMPGLNGFETAKLIKEREKSKYISIIFITALNQTIEHVISGYKLGAVDYIFKPFHPETLKMKVNELVKIYQNQESIKLQGDFRRKRELKIVNDKLVQTELDLRKAEALSRVIGETLLDTIITFDSHGTILSTNPAVRNMFGYSTEELLGQNVAKLIPETKNKNEQVISIELENIKKGKGNLIEAIGKRKNTETFPVDIQVGEAAIEGEQIFVVSIRDITIRKKADDKKKQQYDILENLVQERAQKIILANEKLQQEIVERIKIEEELRSSQELFYKIFESSPGLIEIRSLLDGRYININQSWLNYTGYSREEVLGKNNSFLTLKAHSNSEDIQCIGTQEGGILNLQVEYQTKDGETRCGLLSTEVFDIQGEKCVLRVITDITERLHLENEMARLDRLNIIGSMAAGIAHEIRNPMTTVRGFLELSKNYPDYLRRYIDIMVGELDRANSIITEYLNLAKNKVSYKKLQNLNVIIQTLYPLIQAQALGKDKFITLQLGECPELFLDEKEIRQLILNLSFNGLDAMDSGGSLVIKTYVKGQEVVLEVKDEGCGIDKEIIPQIGTPFFTTKDKGTGLGLAICYSIAKRHNAAVNLKTNENGTVFYIHFNTVK